MRSRAFIWTAAVLALMACDPGPAELDPFLGIRAERYLIEVLDLMESFSIKRNQIDWPAFREQTIMEAGLVQEPHETYPAIIAAIERLGDGHSFFQPAPGFAVSSVRIAPASTLTPAIIGYGTSGGLATLLPGTSPSPVTGAPGAASQLPDGPADAEPSSMLVEPGVAYVDITAFSGGGQAADSVASVYHSLIEAVDTLGATCRWVVDVRGNTGGNMWPMIAGIGPVLGEGDVGFFVDPDSVVLTWRYQNGIATVGQIEQATAEPTYALASPDPHVAVLTDSLTASSGEAVAIAFRGRADTRSFGGSTWGVSTANQAFLLSDRAVLFLTVSTMADRLGTIYGEEVVPDEAVAGDKTGDPQTDAVLDAALQWLRARSCA